MDYGNRVAMEKQPDLNFGKALSEKERGETKILSPDFEVKAGVSI